MLTSHFSKRVPQVIKKSGYCSRFLSLSITLSWLLNWSRNLTTEAELNLYRKPFVCCVVFIFGSGGSVCKYLCHSSCQLYFILEGLFMRELILPIIISFQSVSSFLMFSFEFFLLNCGRFYTAAYIVVSTVC